MMDSSNPQPGVLIVEDEPELREMYAEWLTETYRVATAEDAATALEALDESIDVVLLDRKLPDAEGEQLIPDIKTSTQECQIAMVTSVEPEWATLEMDINAYITKPVREDDLNFLVDALCRHDYMALARRDGVIL